jgi:phage internal scaffolding protein
MAKPSVVRRRVQLDTRGDKVLVQQSFKDEANINVLMRRYSVTGVAPVGVGVAKYGDFSDVGDYLAARSVVADAEEQFASLPAELRDLLGNDPARFLEFVADQKNIATARKYGLLKDEVAPIVDANAVPEGKAT